MSRHSPVEEGDYGPVLFVAGPFKIAAWKTKVNSA